jgi:23S rRNA (adenine-N6)-dimethyltransferase
VPAEPQAPWGYHQLIYSSAYRLVKAAGIRPGDLVLDVGAGGGSITAHLLATGARVIAVELHPVRARRLRQRFGSSIVVVQTDAADLRLPRHPFKVVANPPFGITTALLRRLLGPNSRVRTADIVVPAYVAGRWASARAPGANRWAVIFHARVAARLPTTAFRPSAPMATAILRIERHARSAGDPNAPPRSERGPAQLAPEKIGISRRSEHMFD